MWETVNYTLNIILVPEIVYQPTNQMVLDGNSAIFGVGALGGQPLSFQW